MVTEIIGSKGELVLILTGIIVGSILTGFWIWVSTI